MTAPIGAVVSIYVDLPNPVDVGDIIETQTGRRYGVVAVRVQARALARRPSAPARRRALALTLDRKVVATKNGDGIDITEVPATIHRIRWYVRARGRR